MNRSLSLLISLLSLFQPNAQSPSESLKMELLQLYQSSDLPGFSVAIVNQNETLYQHSFGFANKESETSFKPTTTQYLGSVSKTMVGLALIKAIEGGYLTMETEINDILPFRVVNPFFSESPILVRHLANHTSTLLDTKHYGKTYVVDDRFLTDDQVHQDFLGFLKSHKSISMHKFLFNILSEDGEWYKKKNFIKAQPGDNREYANLNAALAGYIIEISTGMSLEAFSTEKIFEPLNMQSSTWDSEKKNRDSMATPYFPGGQTVPQYKLITFPDGGLIANTTDLANLLKEMIKAFSGKSTYLPYEYTRLLLPGDDDEYRAFWGMGEESRNIGHGGSDPGVQTDLQFNADSKVGRVILSNVNAEDNEGLWDQYRKIHEILAKYEDKLNRE